LPELEAVDGTATVFVISDLIGKRFLGQPVMSREMLKALISKGWEVGSHTRTHPNLTQISDFQVSIELRDSKKHLERITSSNITSMAYPFGSFNSSLKAIAAKYYTFARSVSCYPPLRINTLYSSDLLELKAVSTYEHPTRLPLHLFENHIAPKIGPRTPKTRNFAPKLHLINPTRKGLEARFVKKWLQNLRSNQWLILNFHNISESTDSTSYTIALEQFREIVKVSTHFTKIVTLAEGARGKCVP
jgi:peptidoglycan/xylan/chitin deacetylase (PgdA/CDA1 family)